MPATNPCSCPEAGPHEVARRRLGNGVSIVLERDAEGFYLGSRFQFCHRGALPAELAWALVGEVELCQDMNEVFDLVAAGRKLFRRGKLTPGALRAAAFKGGQA